METNKSLPEKKRIRLLKTIIIIIASIISGLGCVGFMKLFEIALKYRLDFNNVGIWAWIITPLVFLLTTEIIKRLAPVSGGTGIPQIIFAANNFDKKNKIKLMPLISTKTLIIKILCFLMVIAAGASTGPEGPSIHVSACLFMIVILLFQRFTGITTDYQSAIVAGGAAGLAASFNTPLAGVTFAIEELMPDYFASIKDIILLGIITAGLTAKYFTGEYSYFGHLSEPTPIPFMVILLIGVVSGLSGSLFSVAIIEGQNLLRRFASYRIFLVIIFSLGLMGLAYFFGTIILGPGHEVIQSLLAGQWNKPFLMFPIIKSLATFFTCSTGTVSGIFAPALSIGAYLGADIGYWTQVSIPTCALVGMAGFLASTMQAPITSFVIIFEMTGHHQMLLPLMISAVLGTLVARLLNIPHLYKTLAKNYQFLFSGE